MPASAYPNSALEGGTLARLAYVDGRYVPLGAAAVSVEDRGFQFADGVYEVCAVWGGRLVNEAMHLERLSRSLRELRIAPPMPELALRLVMRTLIRRNRLADCLLYIQITRGVAKRDHPFPAGVAPTLVMTVRPFDFDKAEARSATGVAVITLPDIRWGRCDIKTVALLPNVLAKQAARESGAFEAWLVDEAGRITEGTSTSAWLVSPEGRLITRPLSDNILPGVARRRLIALAGELQLQVEERAFSVEEAMAAPEAFLTSAGNFVTPVVSIDGRAVGSGRPGPVVTRLRAAYRRLAES